MSFLRGLVIQGLKEHVEISIARMAMYLESAAERWWVSPISFW
jgi:hypothetical protein